MLAVLPLRPAHPHSRCMPDSFRGRKPPGTFSVFRSPRRVTESGNHVPFWGKIRGESKKRSKAGAALIDPFAPTRGHTAGQKWLRSG